MTLSKVSLERFTAFEDLTVEFSAGVNAFIGANGTGKTHLMKVGYAACEVSKTGDDLLATLIRTFLPSGNQSVRLVKQGLEKGTEATVAVHSGERVLSETFDNAGVFVGSVSVNKPDSWAGSPIESVYIPAKDMLANAPGFLSLYAAREVHFEEVYRDILHRAYLPPLRGPLPEPRQRLLNRLQKAVGGEIVVEGEEFFLNGEQGKVEFTLLAEGLRKLGLLWLLIRNGSLPDGSVLFWDEPETNLNPSLYGTVIDALLELQRDGVQIFLATHDYVILKELDLQMTEEDAVAFHSLYRDEETGEIACRTTHHYLDIRPNAIDEKFTDLYDREIERSIRGIKNDRSDRR